MSIFYKHEDRELVNINELVRDQIKKEYNLSGYPEDFAYSMGQLYFNDLNQYMIVHNLMFKDTYVYLSYCSKNNEMSVEDKYYFDLIKNVNNDEELEFFIINYSDILYNYSIYFMQSNILYKTRTFLELSDDENLKLTNLFPTHILDIQDFVEDLGIKTIIDYYNTLLEQSDELILNVSVANDIINFIKYLYKKDIYLFENLISDIKSKIYKWNKYLIDNSNEDFMEDEVEFVDILEENDNILLGERALQNSYIMNKMICQLFDYEIDKKEVIIDSNGKKYNVYENEVDEYIKKLSKKR